MKTLYEILEVSESASNEIIEKAYKVLAKKYHPDLQEESNKADAEKRMKEINEAYEVLGNDVKRKEYDETLRITREQEKEEEIQRAREQERAQNYAEYENRVYTDYMNQEPSSTNSVSSTNVDTNGDITRDQEAYDRELERQRRYNEEVYRRQEEMQRQMQYNMQKQYENAYYAYLKSLGFRIKERWTWKKTKELVLTLIIMAIVVLIMWIFPPTHDMLVDLYNSNQFVKIIVDIVGRTFSIIFEAIGKLFGNIFNK